MKLKQLFSLTAVATSLILAGCGGDINIDASTDNSVVNNGSDGGNNNGGGSNVTFPDESPITLGLASKDTALSSSLDKDVYVISGEITEDVVLHADVYWAVEGKVFVGKDIAADGYTTEDSATLDIEAGATIFGKSGSDALIISRGSKINALGTATKPIVFTAFQDLNGTVNKDDSGLWGGIVLNGQAPNSEGANVPGEADTGTYGGDIADDNSGVLKYVQVRFAGFKVDGENELNGVAFQSVGSGTTVEYLQVHNNSDDGVEFFGGTVNAKYLVLTGNQDDSLDWTQGWSGKVQHVYIKHNSVGGDHAFEGDGAAGGTPNSNPVISNVTFLGSDIDTSNGMDIRKGSDGQFYNFLFVGGNAEACLDIDDDIAKANAAAGTLKIENSILNCDTPFADSEGATTIADWFAASDTNIQDDAKLVNYMPVASSPALGAGKNVANDVDGYFDTVDYIGAFDGTNDWTLGWTYGIHNTVTDCPQGTTEVAEVTAGQLTCAISGTLTEDVTLSPGAVYQLTGAVIVGKDIAAQGYTTADSATLTIEPGVTVFGQSGADYLIVSRGSKIEAAGSVSAPIVFTSVSDVKGTVSEDDSGLWGGIVLNGQAPNSEGANVPGEANTGTYGGNIADDNSGTLQYVQVKYAGFKVDGENELNGVAFQSVGSGTTVDYLQVHNNSDDGVEFFGGTVSAKHLVLTGNQDDSLDWTQGWVGNVQYVLIKQNDLGGDHALEGDGAAGGTPNSKPTIANLTFIGSNSPDSNGIDIRKGSEGAFYNFLFVEPAIEGSCLDIDDDIAKANAVAGSLSISTSVLSCAKNYANAEAQAWFETATAGNEVVAGVTVDANFVASSTGTVTATDMSTVSDAFDATDYVGAVKDANDTWYKNWTHGL
ncbi:hypothetical protein N7931_01605 [Catenovulum sp. 2E275]|uniref:hypothetical protein n=1 Tax=Catenovulum sp. 2E275 TaxID=2980497 RepID=UPI0021CF4D83|nr:hypothetical protein [Catenovulum sp. 2E275]MCU4674315.1 hypothetical protein [Catenovulum sp. 2E275]